MREEIRVVRLEAGAERERLNDEVAKLQQKVRVLESHIKKLETK
jgi:cell division protein FtsB